MPAKIYLAAQARLLEIWDYTERTWGEAQADVQRQSDFDTDDNQTSTHVSRREEGV